MKSCRRRSANRPRKCSFCHPPKHRNCWKPARTVRTARTARTGQTGQDSVHLYGSTCMGPPVWVHLCVSGSTGPPVCVHLYVSGNTGPPILIRQDRSGSTGLARQVWQYGPHQTNQAPCHRGGRPSGVMAFWRDGLLALCSGTEAVPNTWSHRGRQSERPAGRERRGYISNPPAESSSETHLTPGIYRVFIYRVFIYRVFIYRVISGGVISGGVISGGAGTGSCPSPAG